MAGLALVTAQPFKLNGASPLTTTGDLLFTCPQNPPGGDFSAIFQVVGTLTTLACSLQVSLDGGTTYNDLIVAGSFLTPAAPVILKTPLVAGALYRIHITTLTGSQDFWVVTD